MISYYIVVFWCFQGITYFPDLNNLDGKATHNGTGESDYSQQTMTTLTTEALPHYELILLSF
jgi:hypothetical protein